jgi:hypothetical protein
MSLYILEVTDGNDKLQYEYGCLEHAREHLSWETAGSIYEYVNGQYYFVEGK